MGMFDGASSSEVRRLARQVAELGEQVTRLEALLELVADHLGVDRASLAAIQPAEPAYVAHARRLKSEGKAIAGIKVVREHTGLGLADAKALVDAL